MSKSSSSHRRGKGTAGKGGHDSLSLSAFRAAREVDALTPAFVQWFDDGSPGAAVAALECMVPVKDVLGRYQESTAAAEITGFDPIALAEAISVGYYRRQQIFSRVGEGGRRRLPP